MKIAVFEVEPWECAPFEQLQSQHEIVYTDQPLNSQTVQEYADADMITTFIYSELKNDILRQFKNLKLIATRSTGFDHIDINYCQENDITVCNVPQYGDHTVAEHVFALLLTISHNMYQAIDRTRKGDFSLQGLRGFDLRGKTLGVIGTGKIGQCVIEIARGFGMKVLAFDIQSQPDLEQKLGFEYVSMDELLINADIITLHVPATPKTENLLSTAEFNKMKKGVVLINTARGVVVDVHALLKALADGTVAAAGLDVLPEEPVIREEAELLRATFQQKHNLETILADHILLRLRNVYITPHSAFDTKEAVQRILDTTVKNIEAFTQGKPVNVVTEARQAAKVH